MYSPSVKQPSQTNAPDGDAAAPGRGHAALDAERVVLEPPSRRMHRFSLILLALGVVLRLRQYLFNRSLWVDEAMIAINILNRSYAELLGPLDHFQAAPWGFLAVERSIVNLWGGHEYALRLFPLIAGLASLILFYLLVRRLLPPVGTAAALALFVFSVPLCYYATEVKQYASDAAAAIALLWLAIPALKRGVSWPRGLGLAFAGALAVWVSHPAVFVLAAIGAVLMGRSLRAGRGSDVFPLTMAGLIWLISFAPFYALSIARTADIDALQDYWQTYFFPLFPNSVEDVKWYIRNAFDFFNEPVGLKFAGLGAFLSLAGVYRLAREGRGGLIALLALPAGFMLIASGLEKYPVVSRLLLFLVPAALIFIGAGIQELYDRLPRSRILLALGLGVLFLHPVLWSAESAKNGIEKEELRGVMENLSDEVRPGDVVYLYYFSAPAWDYYEPRYDFTGADIVVGVKARQDWRDYYEDLRRFQGRERLWLVFSHVADWFGADEEKLMLHHLELLGGERIQTIERTGAAAYLYDMSGEPADEGS